MLLYRKQTGLNKGRMFARKSGGANRSIFSHKESKNTTDSAFLKDIRYSSTMKLELKIINQGSNIQLLSIAGNFESGHITPLGNEFAKLCQGPPVHLILDVRDAKGITASGINELIKVRNEIVDRGGKVVLIGVNSRIQTMINVSGLNKYFPLVDSESDAIHLLSEKAS
jgi:anti-anti-sigma factor